MEECRVTTRYCTSTPCGNNKYVRTYVDYYTGRTCAQYCECV
ncbi:hypothetical protein Theco_3291 [Thermobacillus composti KWC4]|jgi:hypothetical protein|uniref:Uncharacterized protein n=1 Tax=Thermobacillus composti (strain DSM 18247 / JCM 13945 / KWC4) TaxID=717605 RepID=L0EGG8_THECK|nr:hypothetical protein Theco_3291 [Thermobacillus composti KWC4]